MVKQMKELGIKAKFIAGDGVCSAEWPLAGGAAEGQYRTQAGVPPEKMANAKDFVTRFNRHTGRSRSTPRILRRGDDADRGDAEANRPTRLSICLS
jgi:ABC-type branched-subunit amino acid transport system substrate-binding protein